MSVLGDNIKKLRTAAKMTQQELADYLGINRVAVSYLETGEREDLSIVNMEKLADLFFIDSFDLYSPDMVITIPVKDIPAEDREHVARFFRIVKNYIRMSKLSDRHLKIVA